MVKGYKVFNPDWTCQSKKYTCPGIFEESGELTMCKNGMHFCKKAADCFNYYSFDCDNHVAEVIAHGDVIEKEDKCCTNKLEIVRELTWNEVLEIVNTGKGCTGNRNSCNWNSGNCNSGNWNSGNWNSGNRNSGNWNSGDCNSGNCNSGNWNSGDWNSGDCNSGNWNSGDWNSGNRNSGDWNSTMFSNGCFNTIEPKIYLFDRPSEWTYPDWRDSDACSLLARIRNDVLKYIYFDDMTDDEKAKHPEAKTTGGYLKKLDNSECSKIWWRGLSPAEKQEILDLPNFDKKIFKEIIGVDVDND